MGKPLKNTYSTSRNIFTDIEKELVKHGATEVSFLYESGLRVGVAFTVQVQGHPVSFRIPVDIAAVQAILKKQARTYALGKTYTMEKAAQVAWANIRDWISAEMAMIDMGQGSMEQRFIGHLLEPGGRRTLNEIVAEDHYLLPEHKEITIERGG